MDDLTPEKYQQSKNSRQILLIAFLFSLIVHVAILVWFKWLPIDFSSQEEKVDPSSLQVTINHPPPVSEQSITEEPPIEIPPQNEVVDPVVQTVESPKVIAEKTEPVEVEVPADPIPEPTEPKSNVKKFTRYDLKGVPPPDKDLSHMDNMSVSKGTVSDDEWSFNPEVLEKLNQARAAGKAYKEHKAEVEKLQKHLFSQSGKISSSYDGPGIFYERVGTAPAAPIFALLGAKEECYRVERFPDGRVIRTQISCANWEVRWDKRDELYVHPSLRTEEERVFRSKEEVLESRTYRERFIDQLSDSLPPNPDPKEYDGAVDDDLLE